MADIAAAIDAAAPGARPVDTFRYVVDDGYGETATETIDFKVDRPLVLSVTTQPLTYAEPVSNPNGGVPLLLISDATIADADLEGADRLIDSATIGITGGGAFAADLLTIGGATSGTLADGAISFSYTASTRTLTLIGSATFAQYESALNSVTFSSEGEESDYLRLRFEPRGDIHHQFQWVRQRAANCNHPTHRAERRSDLLQRPRFQLHRNRRGPDQHEVHHPCGSGFHDRHAEQRLGDCHR